MLLDEVGRGRGGLVRGPPEYPSAVAAEVLKRFAVCLKEVKTFLGSKELTFPELEQPECLEKLHFMVDVRAPEKAEYNRIQRGKEA